MLFVLRTVLLACPLVLTNCSQDSAKLGAPPQDPGSVTKAFAQGSISSGAGVRTCLPFFDPCSTSSAAKPSVARRLARSVEHEPVQALRSAQVLEPSQVPQSTSSSGVFTVIAGAEDWLLFSELVNVLNGHGLRVLPVVGLSARSDLEDITRNGVDLAVVPANALEVETRPGERPENPIRYIGRLYKETLQVFARRDVADLRELDGRKVNVGPAGSGSEIAARTLFAVLGIRPVVTMDHADLARQRLKSGDIDAAVFLAAWPAFQVTEMMIGEFRLLPVSHELLPGSAYEPASLEASQFPTLVGTGNTVPTVSVANVLAVSDALRGSQRYERLNHFVREFYKRAELLHQPGRSPQWKNLDPGADVPGWTRFQAADEWLKIRASSSTRASLSSPPSWPAEWNRASGRGAIEEAGLDRSS